VDFQPVMVNQGRWPNDVRAICEDHEGNLWLGISGGGLTQLRSQSFVLLKGSAGLPPGAATCLALDTGGRVCVGMESGGVYALIGEGFEKLADDTRVLGQDLPLSLCAGSDGSLWVSTMGTGLYRLRNGRAAACTTANGLSDDCVLTVCTEANGTVWAGTQAGALHRLGNGGLTTFGTSDGLPGTPLTALLPARGGGLWVGSGNGVVLRSDAEFKNVSPVHLSPKLNGKSILSLYEDGQRNLWVGTGGGGLACVDGARCSSWDSQDGLPDDVISGIVEDGEANLWLMTDQGLCRLARGSLSQGPTGRAPLKTRLLFETEAANANRAPNVGGPRALRATDGRLWFATSGGLVGIDTRGWAAEKPAPQVHLEAVLVNKRPLDFATRSAGSNHGDGNAEPIRLPASLRELEFQFTALSFEAPEKVRFRHKLERLNTDWIETGPERRVSYGRLPSGTYEFHVTACNAEGVWNETGASLAFIIPTPLWRAPWALGLYGLSAAGGVAGTVRLVSHRRLRRRLARLEQQQATERERVRIAQDMHDEIGSKLTKISFLSERAKVELPGKGPLAEKLDSIAGTSRELLQALDEIVWAVNPRNDTLEQLGAYLSQYAREYFHNTPIECDVSLQGELPHLAMSADTRHNLFLAFEEALNNVLKHAGASRVQVEIRAEDEKLQIKVVDNGHGFKLNVGSSPNSPPVEQSREPDAAAATEGNGLVNMRQRLADIGGQCDVSSIVGQGTTVCLCTSLSSAKLSFP
jgi:signal transduction histidine kinase